MKFSKFVIALGFFTLLASSCTRHTSCPAYSSQDDDRNNLENVLEIEESNV